MKRFVLLAGVATALAIAPSAAFAGDYNQDPITFENHVSTTLVNASFDYNWTFLYGGMVIDGYVDPDSAAKAITDAKQIQSYETVTFSDPGKSSDYGCNHDGCDSFGGDHSSDPASVTNDASAGDVNGDGNVGVNVAAGQYNMQQNSANIAVSADSDPNASGGWASAATTGYQSLTDTSYGVNDLYVTFDNNYQQTHYQDTNTATGGNVGGSGNVGVNVAAGAFNQQQNLMTLAVANNSILSQSNAALWQTASCNQADIQNQQNTATSGVVNGAGNLGVNIAAGIGNQQQNALTAAVSGPFGG